MQPNKESVEVENISTPGQDRSQDNGANSRSNPVCLEVPVTIRSLPVDRENGAAMATKPIREEAHTVIVFDNGAVLRLSSNLPAGQAVIVSNLQGRDVVSRVIVARNMPTVKGYIEIEFLEPVQDFWGLNRAVPEATAVPKVPPVTTSAQPIRKELSPSTDMPTGTPIAAPKANENSFSSGNEPSFDDIAGLVRMTPAPGVRADSGAPKQATPISSILNADALAEALVDVAEPRIVVKSNATTANLKPLPVAARTVIASSGPIAAAHTDFAPTSARDTSSISFGMTSSPSRSKVPLIIGATAVLLVIGAGAFFMHRGSSPAPVVPKTSAAVSEPVQPTQTVSTAPLQTVAVEPVSATVPSVAPSRAERTPEVTIEPEKANPVSSTADVKRRIPVRGLKMSSPMAANRKVAVPSDSSAGIDIASTLGAVPVAGALPSLGRLDNPPAPPSLAKSLVEAKVISSVRPIFPDLAKRTGTQGIVVVVAEIDPNGKVGEVVVKSGPGLLRQAAIDAVKQSKFQPAQLNGKPVSSHVTMNLDFRL